MSDTTTRTKSRNDEIRFILSEIYPDVFMPKGAPKKPLAIGIGEALRLAFPEVGGKHLARALGDYTSGPTYLRACIAGAARIGLDGKPSGEVSEQQADHAKARLAALEKYISRQGVNEAVE